MYTSQFLVPQERSNTFDHLRPIATANIYSDAFRLQTYLRVGTRLLLMLEWGDANRIVEISMID